MLIELDNVTVGEHNLRELGLNDLRRACRKTGYFKGNSQVSNYIGVNEAREILLYYLQNDFTKSEDCAHACIREHEKKNKPDTEGQLTQAIAQALQATGFAPKQAELDEDKVIDLIRKHSSAPVTLSVQMPEREKVEVGIQHKHFSQLLGLCAARLNVWLYGPAGTGKTSAAKSVAKALSLDFGFVAFSRQSSKGDLFGIRDARGEYHESQFMKIYRNGGVILLDEIDCANDNVLKSLNAALDNGFAVTPDGMVEKHAECVVIAGANTVGNGADAEYSAAQQIDASTLDRFFFLHWPVDEALEAAMIGAGAPDESADTLRGADVPTKEQWLHVVRSARRNGSANRVWISSRAVRDGAILIGAGIKLKDLCQGLIWRGHAKDVQSMLYTIGSARG